MFSVSTQWTSSSIKIALIIIKYFNHLFQLFFRFDSQGYFCPEKNDCIHPAIVFFFFSLPDITLRFGTIKPSFANANTTIGFSTFLKSNEPNELILNLAMFLILSCISSEKRMLFPEASGLNT